MSGVVDVDQRIAAWTEWLQRVDDNLLALEAEPTYQMLAGPTCAPLEGVSHQRVTPALDALADLFEHRQRLGDVFERAKELRASIGFFGGDDKLKQIALLLDGPSIHLGARAKPLAERGLLDRGAEEVLVSPEQLLAAMQRAFEGARDAVLAVQRAWSTLEPSLERMEREASDLRALAERVGELAAAEPELLVIERELGAARARVAKDPLGTTGSVEGALAPRIAEVRRRLGGLSALRERVASELARAADLRRELGLAHQKAQATLTAVHAEYAGASVPEGVAPDLLDGLDAWREKLEKTAAARRWQGAAVGLERWVQTCEGYLAASHAVVAAAEALEKKRDELRGRLSARVAQLRALVSRGAAPAPQLEALARQADAALSRRPVTLEAAEITVTSFEQGVVNLSRRGGKP